MGRNRRGGKDASRFEELVWQDRYSPIDELRPQFQTPRGQRDNFSRFKNPFEKTQPPRSQPWPNDHHHINTGRPPPQQKSHPSDPVFLAKSMHLKQYLVRALNAALIQIEQWYPEPRADDMDWQYEEELVVPPLKEASFVWGSHLEGNRKDFPKASGADVPRGFSIAETLRVAGFRDGEQYSTGADYKTGFFEKESNTAWNTLVPQEMEMETV